MIRLIACPVQVLLRLLSAAIVSFALLSFSIPASAEQAKIDTVELFEFESLQQQKQAIELAKTLRCPMCQNQNLIESNSPVAKDLRLRVFELIREGKSNQQVKDYMVDRYGEHVLYRPSFSFKNGLLWGVPILCLLLVILNLFITFKRKQKPS
ncbi:cytochrome c-type biogenesis protein CcmH [Vibrio sp. ZSDZ34]|uniref:Cytochrome c-type biogenesis protein n=1 Tax=Vibrio gelatinilyticus TaxID=2893468 RepID=A0A9X1W9K5_9VIBR|nr:cytochrome c-type biogenesis protein [Vibrio gelatinilyticus]MCJ2376518.1 cytochrome c-type biogenesis protein CcmH [Vibrio gelatinilyticus]